METSTEINLYGTHFIHPEKVSFAFDGENLTFNSDEGIFYPRVTLRRCFPLSSENTNIAVRGFESSSENTYEIGILKNVYDLDEQSLDTVLLELQRHYVVPEILLVNNIREEFGFLYWDVETDRGHKEFTMRDSIVNSTRRINSVRWLLIDINQTRYEIRDLTCLSKRCQKLIERYLLL